MKKCIKSILVSMIIGMSCLSSMHLLAASPQNETAYLERYQSVVQTMKTAMENAPKTGDTALDYLNQMIPHHEAAVQMAQNVLQYGSNQKVKQMAEKTIKDQTDEIAEMRNLIDEIKKKLKIDKAQEAAYMSDFMIFYDAMVTAMEDIKPTGNVDKDFLQEMMPHHDGAINMSLNILRYTNNLEVKQMAENIIKKQSTEIREMDKLLN